MSRLDLDALERALAAMTPGPWHVGENDGPTLASMYRGHLENHHARIDGECDARAIVAAINAAPAMIARVRELEAGLREACDRGSLGRLWKSDIDRLRALLPKETP